MGLHLCNLPTSKPLTHPPTHPHPDVQYWVGELKAGASGQPLMVLVGNKSDLAEEARAVSREEAAALASRWVQGAGVGWKVAGADELALHLGGCRDSTSDLAEETREVSREDAAALAGGWTHPQGMGIVGGRCSRGAGGQGEAWRCLPNFLAQLYLTGPAFLPCSNGMLHIETSAKTGSNVAELFELIAEQIAGAPPGGGAT